MFAQAGLASPVIGSIVVGALNTGGTLLAASLIDRAGRRTLLLTSHTAMAACLAALAAANLLPGAFPHCCQASSLCVPAVPASKALTWSAALLRREGAVRKCFARGKGVSYQTVDGALECQRRKVAYLVYAVAPRRRSASAPVGCKGVS